MYTLVSGYGIAASSNHGWIEINKVALDLLPMNQMFNLYRRLYLTIRSPVFVDPLHVDIDIFRTENLNNTQTLSSFLSNLSNNTLETVTEIPKYKTEQIQYEDGFRAGYKMEISAPYSHISSVVHPEDKTEIRIHRPNTNMQRFFDHCMVSVNGFWHRTDTDGKYAYVIGGGKSLLQSRMNNIGFTNFEKIGKIKQYPITKDMIYKLDDSDYYKNRAYFDLTGIDTVDKTVMIVIGGYLYLPDPAYVKQYSEHTWKIDFTGVPLLARYIESMKYIDSSELNLTKFVNNPKQIKTAEFFSDEHFTKYLTHKQSFIVVVDTPKLYFNKQFIRHSTLPGMFTTYTEPKFPLITSNGRVAEYWKTFEDGHWSVNVHEAFLYNRQALDARPEEIVTVTEANTPYKLFYNSKGYLLEIGADVKQSP